MDIFFFCFKIQSQKIVTKFNPLVGYPPGVSGLSAPEPVGVENSPEPKQSRSRVSPPTVWCVRAGRARSAGQRTATTLWTVIAVVALSRDVNLYSDTKQLSMRKPASASMHQGKYFIFIFKFILILQCHPKP